MSYIAARTGALGAKPGEDPAIRFRAALAEHGTSPAERELRQGDPPSLAVRSASREDFDKARAVLLSTRYGTPTFEGLRVDFTIGTGLAPRA